jgi:hypothetical protein
MMSLKPDPIPPIPPTTAQVARAAFSKGNIYLQMRDTLGTLFTDEQFADLFPLLGQPAASYHCLTPLQQQENFKHEDNNYRDSGGRKCNASSLLAVERHSSLCDDALEWPSQSR